MQKEEERNRQGERQEGIKRKRKSFLQTKETKATIERNGGRKGANERTYPYFRSFPFLSFLFILSFPVQTHRLAGMFFRLALLLSLGNGVLGLCGGKMGFFSATNPIGALNEDPGISGYVSALQVSSSTDGVAVALVARITSLAGSSSRKAYTMGLYTSRIRSTAPAGEEPDTRLVQLAGTLQTGINVLNLSPNSVFLQANTNYWIVYSSAGNSGENLLVYNATSTTGSAFRWRGSWTYGDNNFPTTWAQSPGFDNANNHNVFLSIEMQQCTQAPTQGSGPSTPIPTPFPTNPPPTPTLNPTIPTMQPTQPTPIAQVTLSPVTQSPTPVPPTPAPTLVPSLAPSAAPVAGPPTPTNRPSFAPTLGGKGSPTTAAPVSASPTTPTTATTTSAAPTDATDKNSTVTPTSQPTVAGNATHMSAEEAALFTSNRQKKQAITGIIVGFIGLVLILAFMAIAVICATKHTKAQDTRRSVRAQTASGIEMQ